MAEIQDFSATDAANTARWPEGMLGNQINNAGRADEGILARWYQDMNASRTASGSLGAFAVTSSRTISALVDNLSIVFTANHAITGASTLNLNGLGAKDIKRLNGMATANGDIVSGQPVYVTYKLAADDWFMMSAPASLATPTLQVSEVAEPSTPASGEAVFFTDTSGRPKHKNDAGVVSGLIGFVQRVTAAAVTAHSEITSSIPSDDTVPLVSEGTELFSQAITPTTTGSRVVLELTLSLQNSGTGSEAIVAVFRGSTCIQVFFDTNNPGGVNGTLVIDDAPASVAAQTYSVRVGTPAGTVYVNGDPTGRQFGGAMKQTLTLTEYLV